MEFNREELRVTTGGLPERMVFSAKKKSLSEASAGQHPRFGSQDPIAEGFSHRASPSDSAHALPEISSLHQWMKRPTCRSVFL
jgi:hypothetical protein